MTNSPKKYSELLIAVIFSAAAYLSAFLMEGLIGFIPLKKANQAIMITLNSKNQ
jgi:hypothetical protein